MGGVGKKFRSARKRKLEEAAQHEECRDIIAAKKSYQKAIHITPKIAHELIMKEKNVRYVVAPYEADAQITFLAISGQVEAVIADGGDFIPFGCPRMLLEMCILRGCDYLPAVGGIRIPKAKELITEFKSYDKVIQHLREESFSLPNSYEESFKKAKLTFQHQPVYDPRIEDIVHLSPILDKLGLGFVDFDFLGSYP
ncbi:XPG/Rad2 endonuclease [Corchorus olitorius]|uniref:XPG/Rad2 endonuclease n=1 Tax=Corchorus olitorius TaxID=93759 RepID=A0A1R3H874_9ROSI|nr:XPG/Rad2 endonuclease [Corchorus olitorius]